MDADREFWMLVREALLMFVDAIEKKLGMPRTSDMRKKLRNESVQKP